MAHGGSVYFVTHPDVVIDAAVPVPDWPLSARGRERMAAALAGAWVREVRSVWSSPERKAQDGAGMLAAHLGLVRRELDGLRENDRSATGYLPRAEFEAVADAFFAHPTESVRGWERAIDAQARVVAAVDVVRQDAPPGDIAIVAHGGVGALLLAHQLGNPIGRNHDQPGPNGGCLFAFERNSGRMLWEWRLMDTA